MLGRNISDIWLLDLMKCCIWKKKNAIDGHNKKHATKQEKNPQQKQKINSSLETLN